jgi:hypothetical protein
MAFFSSPVVEHAAILGRRLGVASEIGEAPCSAPPGITA